LPGNLTVPRGGPRATGRRIAQFVYFGLAGAVAAAAIWQITGQVFFRSPPPGSAPYASCEAGIDALYQAILRGRAEAENETRDDEAALRRYRQVVDADWRWRDAVASMCGPAHQALLDAVERLRYSEEHGVRHRGGELSALRRRVQQLVTEELGTPSPAR
jgi:hypothetical protein